jgi:hypothetical protein
MMMLISLNIEAQYNQGDVDLDPVIIKAKVKLTDLYIHSLTGIDSIVKVGQRIIPKIIIGNKGNSDANKKLWSWFLYIDGKLVSFNRVYPFDLESGKSIGSSPGYNKKYGSFIFKKSGKYLYKLIIKTKKKLKEFDKTNNIIEGYIRVID